MKRLRPSLRVTSLVFAVSSLIQAGSCYRAEIDLSVLLDAGGSGGVVGAGAASSSAGAGESGAEHAAGGESLRGGAPNGGDNAGQGGAGGAAGDASQELGGAGAGASNGDGPCEDPPFSVDDKFCNDTGIKPDRIACVEQDVSLKGFEGCYNGGCAVCTVHGEVPDYPYYFDWHPCCQKNPNCGSLPRFYCNERCPRPTEHDKVPPCGKRGAPPR